MEQAFDYGVYANTKPYALHIEGFHYECVYVVQKYDLEGNYDCAVFSTKEVAITYARNSYNEMIKPYIKMYKKDKTALDYISKTEGYYVIMFILDAILDNKKIVFDTSDMNND